MSQTKSVFDGSIMTKTYDEAYKLIEKLASNHHQMIYDKTSRKNTLGLIQIDAFNALSSQMATLSMQM